MIIKSLKLAAAVIMVVIVTAGASVSAEIVVDLPDEAEIEGTEIKLGQIADISGTEERTEEIAEMKIDRFYNIENEKEFSRRLIELHLRNAGLSPGEYDLRGAGSIQVVPATQRVDGRKLVDSFINKIEKHYEREQERFVEDVSDVEIETVIEVDDGDDGIDGMLLPAGDVEIRPVGESYKRGGEVNQSLNIYVEGERYDHFNISLEIFHYLEAYVLIEDVSRGEQPLKSRLEKRKVELEQFPEELIIDPDKKLMQNGVFRRSFREGELLTGDMLEYPILIRHGEKVTGRIQVGSVRVHVGLIARDRGRAGEVITMENPQSGESVEAEVVNEDMVEIVEN